MKSIQERQSQEGRLRLELEVEGISISNKNNVESEYKREKEDDTAERVLGAPLLFFPESHSGSPSPTDHKQLPHYVHSSPTAQTSSGLAATSKSSPSASPSSAPDIKALKFAFLLAFPTAFRFVRVGNAKDEKGNLESSNDRKTQGVRISAVVEKSSTFAEHDYAASKRRNTAGGKSIHRPDSVVRQSQASALHYASNFSLFICK